MPVNSEIDRAVVGCTAFHSYDELVSSIENHGYVPTIKEDKCHSADRNYDIGTVRLRLICDGHEVYPPAENFELTLAQIGK